MRSIKSKISTKSFQDKFWSNVAPPDKNGCQKWLGASYLCFSHDRKGRRYSKPNSVRPRVTVGGRSHMDYRVSWMLKHGQIPKGMFICHHCDNTMCVNVDHLFMGTHQDNMDDMKKKGRQGYHKGEAHGMHKLTEEQVETIYTSIEMGRTLAKQFGVDEAVITRIRQRKIWTHVTKKLGAPARVGKTIFAPPENLVQAISSL